jgi:predicted secreted protein
MIGDGPEPHGEAGDATALEELDAEGTAGEPIVLPIAAGPATGYAWRLELPQEVEQLEDGPPRAVDPDRSLGGAGGGFLRVTAPRGEHVLVARLARPWEPDRPVRAVRIRLHVR